MIRREMSRPMSSSSTPIGKSRMKKPRERGYCMRKAIVATRAAVKKEALTTSLNSSVPAPKTWRS